MAGLCRLPGPPGPAHQRPADAAGPARATRPPGGRRHAPHPPGSLERVADLLPAESSSRAGARPGTRQRGGPAERPRGPGAPAARPRFTVLSPHAEGGLGRVHLARDEQLRRTVALKEIRPERADDPRVRQRFLNEAEITGQLEHPGVVPIYALEHDAAGRPVYAMRFIQGRTLSDAIEAHHRRPTALGLRELLQRFISVCQTVAYAHSKGVIHRDLKPDNVMLGDYGETLVVDWGLAKRLGDRDDSFVVADRGAGGRATPTHRPSQLAGTMLDPDAGRPASGSDQLTAAGQVMGTPAYMAPEQARGEALSPAADVYALGAVLFTLLTGKVPYQGTQRRGSAPEGGRGRAAGRRRRARGRSTRSTSRRWPRTRGRGTPRRRSWPATWSGGWPTSRSAPTASRGRPAPAGGRGGTGRS